YATRLAAIGSHLTEDGDILLYGCDIGAGSGGEAFVQALALATGADVAASANATGAAARGGDWVLEYSFGQIESQAVQASAFAGLMAAPTVTGTMKDTSVVEPSTINASPTASEVTLGGWAIGDDEVDSDQVTVQVTLSNPAAGALTSLDPGQGSAIVNGLQFTGTAAEATAWVNQIKFTAADTELGLTAAQTMLRVTVTDHELTPLSSFKEIRLTVTPSNDPAALNTQPGDGTVTVTEGGSIAISGGTGEAGGPFGLRILDPELE